MNKLALVALFLFSIPAFSQCKPGFDPILGTLTCPPPGTITPLIPTTVTPEQFGAKGDGTTDDTTAIQAAINALATTGGTVLFGAKNYLTSAALTITTSYIHLKGQGSSRLIQPVLSSMITNNTLSGNMITLAGSTYACDNTAVTGLVVDGLTLYRSTAATSGTAISLLKTCDVKLNDLMIYNNFHGVKFDQAGNPEVSNVFIYYNTSSGSARYGFDVDTTTSGSVTFYSDRCVVSAASAANGANVRGAYIHGGHITDVEFDRFETAFLDYGQYWDLTSSVASDNRTSNSIFDNVGVNGVYVTAGGTLPGADLKLSGLTIYTQSAATSAKAIVLDTVKGVSLTASKLWCGSSSATIGISLINGATSHNTFVGNKIAGCTTGINISAGILNTFTANDISNATNGVNSTSSANGNTYTANVIFTSVTNGMVFDGGGGNVISSNIVTGSSAHITNTSGANYILGVYNPAVVMTPALNVTGCTGAAKGTGASNVGGTITGTPTGACSIVMTFTNQPAPTAWLCMVTNFTTPANRIDQTARSATTCTFGGTTVSGDVLQYVAIPY